jgi:hypothetical protein
MHRKLRTLKKRLTKIDGEDWHLFIWIKTAS